MDLEANVIYEMVIKDYKYKCIKSPTGIIYTLISNNSKRTEIIMNHLKEDLAYTGPFDCVSFYLDKKLICKKSINEVFNNRSDPNTGMNLMSEEDLWINKVPVDQVESVRDALNKELRKKGVYNV